MSDNASISAVGHRSSTVDDGSSTVNGGSTKFPLISCLMATKNRQGFVPNAIRCFQAQTYPNLELVIVDHGTDATDEIVKGFGDPRIRYERHPDGALLTGDVKNHTIANALGEYVAVWDDDDWHHPARIMIQFQKLRSCQADACLLERLTVAWPDCDRYAYSFHRYWEGSLLSRRHQMEWFGTMQKGEDTVQLHATLKSGKVVVGLDMPDLYIYRIHGRNNWDPGHFEGMFGTGSSALSAEGKLRVVMALAGEDSASASHHDG